MVAVHPRGEQVDLRLEPALVGAQGLQQRLAQWQVAILATLAVYHADDHPLAVDVVDLQADDLGAAHPHAIEDHQQSSLKQTITRVDQTSDFFLAQNAGQLPLKSRIGQELTELRSPQCAYKEEPQNRNMVLNGPRRQLPLLQQVGLIGTQMLWAELIG